MRVSRRLSLLFLFARSAGDDDGHPGRRDRRRSEERHPSQRSIGRRDRAVEIGPESERRRRTNVARYRPQFRTAFEVASDRSGVPLSLLAAVAQTESNFEPNAVSHAGARGLLQVLPSTAQELEIDLNSPGANVLAGARYLRRMLDRFKSLDLALAAYNAGPTAVGRRAARRRKRREPTSKRSRSAGRSSAAAGRTPGEDGENLQGSGLPGRSILQK